MQRHEGEYGVTITVNASSRGGWPLSDEPYSGREDEHTTVEGVTVIRDDKSYDKVSFEPVDGNIVYVVLVRYQSGDTFGTTYGNYEVMNVFDNPLDAQELAEAVDRDADKTDIHDNIDRLFEFEHNGKTYYKAWAGYFERYEGVEVHTVRIGESTGRVKWY